MSSRSSFPEEHLHALGSHLAAAGSTLRLLVVGGAALRMRRLVLRTTQDVDVLAVVGADGEPAPPDLDRLQTLIERVARDFGVAKDWLNTEVAMQWRTGLPPRPLADVEWRRFGNLEVGLAGRGLLIALKLFATADHSAASVHCQDLIALAPSRAELREARDWVLTQDCGAAWASIVDEVIAHVEAHGLS